MEYPQTEEQYSADYTEGEEFSQNGGHVEAPLADEYSMPATPGESHPVVEEFTEEHPALDPNGGVSLTTPGEYHEMRSILADGGDRFGVCSVAFDLNEELLWMGNQGGHITSYYGLDMQKYTSFQIHASNEVRQLLTFDNGVLALTSDNLRCSTRQGMRVFELTGENIHDMQCMLQRNASRLLIGGHHTKLIEVDLITGQETDQYEIDDPGVAILRMANTISSSLLCCGDTSGKIILRDPQSLKKEHVLEAHTGTLSDFDVHGNQLVTCGFSNRSSYVHLWSDRETATYNNFSQPTQFADPVEPLPPIHINDEMTPLSTVPMPFCNGPLLSDWASEYCVAVTRRPPPIDPEILRTMNMVQFIGYAPNLGTKRRNQVEYREVTFANKNKGGKTVPQSPIGRDVDPQMYMVPKKYRKVEIKYSKLGVEDFDFKHYNKTNFAGLETHIPNAYCNSMLQVLFFIEPLRCALETHLCSKEFCLACELSFLFHMLDHCKGWTCQATNFLRSFRTVPEASALGLILADAEESTGKANLRRLIQNWNRFILQQIELDTSEQDETAQALPPTMVRSTFGGSTSTVTRLFQTNAENISKCKCGIENVRNGSTLLFNLNYPPYMPQGNSVLIFWKYAGKSSLLLNPSFLITQVQIKSLKCLPDVLVINCQIETVKDLEFWKAQQEYAGVVIDDNATEKPLSKPCRYGKGCTRKGCKFNHEITEDSLERLVFDLADMGVEETKKSWVPYGLKMKLSSDRTLSVEDIFEENVGAVGEEYKIYDLHASVVHIQDIKTGGNLAAHILVGPTYHKRKEGVTHSNWYLFNDFAIAPIDKHEAVQFNLEWKVPCVLYFLRRDLNEDYECTITSPIKASSLLAEPSMAKAGMKQHIAFTPLQASELPEPGDLVGLDAEFVTLNQEEAEIRSDGTRSTIKPSQMSAARITCVRGQGPSEGVAFIDDYISTQEQVVDYLTQFSGIKPGDLDATMSSKHLTTLKSTYLKLRYLIDQGVTFVGHGLKKDFRVINLLVPQHQVIDTASLFSLPKQRIPSLRFLAWFFLGINIQGVTHDSTEDARSAVMLYKKYKDISNNGEDRENWEATLKNLYDKGRKMGWKVPDDE
uniref:PAB-dependent poly(A)-specific ribonuclease subunit 2-like n=1 Tax=Saccoglossus kowalevskii TaxID=10224 RepID=A0ABM0MGF5_SACKO|nr:PREDICTED: PAB-dependent poly(A)-specific ribonuclease subunit 2-like [Saccoglossus kowalevskii]